MFLDDDFGYRPPVQAPVVRPPATQAGSLTTILPTVFLTDKTVFQHQGMKKTAFKTGWYKVWLTVRGQLRIAFDFSREGEPAPVC